LGGVVRRQALALLVMAVSPVLGVGQSVDWMVGPELFADSELHAGSEVGPAGSLEGVSVG